MEPELRDAGRPHPVALTPRPGRRGARVTLIRPNTVVFPKSLSWYGPVPPIGMAYVAATLRQGGHDVQVIDSAGEAIDRATDFDSPVGRLRRIGLPIEEIVERIHPDAQLVGITHMFLHEWPHIRDLAEAIRAARPEAVIIVGGENATAFWPWMFEQTDAIDACVLGEGEVTALDVADRVANGEPLTGQPGLATRVDGEVVDGGLTTRLTTRRIPEVPRPAWDLFPLDSYWEYADFFGVDRGRSLPIIATRGCPYKCSFCSSPQMWTTRYVAREPEDVADEIADYVHRYGVNSINFADLTAITKRKWTLAFCDALEARELDITWQLPVGTRAEALDREVLQRLWDTGCRNIAYAPEAGGQRMLDVYDKRVDLEHVLRSIADAKAVGLVSKVNIIIGHPEERWGDVLRSLRFLVRAGRAGANDAAVMMFGPYPGSADWKKLVDAGELEIDEAYHYVALSWASSVHDSYNARMSPRQLRWAQMFMLCTFYGVANVLRPRRLWAYWRAQRTGQEATALDALVRTKRRGLRPSPRLSHADGHAA
jgi:anaerobic magnesium-protoporphyrin IX monomethyl ester cyclase